MRKFFVVLSWIVLVSGVALAALHLIHASDIDSPYSLSLGILSAVSAVVGYVRHKQSFIIVFITLTAVCSFGAALVTESRLNQPDTTELAFVFSLVVVIAGLLRFYRLRAPRQRAKVFVDGLIVALGAWLVTWILLVQPALDADAQSGATALRALVLATAIVVLFLLSVLIFSNTSRSYSLFTLSMAILMSLVGIIMRAMSFRDDINLTEVEYSVPFLISLACIATAFLHPDSHNLAARRSSKTAAPLLYRFATLSTALVVPIIFLALTDPTDLNDRLVRTFSVAFLVIVVMTRVIQSVRENTRAQDDLMRNALTDSLTGLPNRILVLEHISTELHQSWMSNRRPTVLFIDVDRFKNINDSLGHSTGDSVLTHVASRLLLAVPETATVARISGDEFVVLDPTTESPTQSVLLAEKILDSLRVPVPTSGGDMFVTASIGVAYAPKNIDLTADQLLRHADTAMYRAKDAGRNCIALFDDTMLDLVTKRLDVETSLYTALEKKELHLAFQPIVDMTIGVVVGFEALMRWEKNQQAVPPSEFIPIAEDTGIIVPLGTWAMNDALSHLSSWISQGVVAADTTMSVNVSAKQLHDPQFITHVRDALRNNSVSPDQLLLEVTESVMITETSQALAAMKALSSLGVRIAVDDFGTGYSSLSVLQHFPIDSIKIDRAFVQDLEKNTDATTLVRTIIAMANALGSDVIAEGVESEIQMRSLISMNCIKAQGYHFFRPINAESVPQGVAELQNRDTWLDDSGHR